MTAHARYFFAGSSPACCGAVTARRARAEGHRPSSAAAALICEIRLATILRGARSNSAANSHHRRAVGMSCHIIQGAVWINARQSSRCLFPSLGGASSPLSKSGPTPSAMSTGLNGRRPGFPRISFRYPGIDFRPRCATLTLTPLGGAFPISLHQRRGKAKPRILIRDSAYERLHRSGPPFIGRDLHTPCPL